MRGIEDPSLIARCGLSASGLRNADVAGYFILANLVDDHFQRAAIVALVEEDWFVYRQVLLVDVNVVDDQRNAIALLVEVRALEFDHERANLLRLVLGVDRELEVVPLTEPAKLFHIFMIARDQGSQFAARHFQNALCGVQIRADSRYFAVHGLNVIVGSFCGQLGLYRAVHLSYFLLTLGLDCRGFLVRLFQVALGDAESLGYHAQVALQPGIGRVGLCLMLLEGRDLGSEICLQALNRRVERLLDFLGLRRGIVRHDEPYQSHYPKDRYRRDHPPWCTSATLVRTVDFFSHFILPL